MDMPPNETLFDAINRGDMATARDALSRGADLNARNVLGMTPLDLAVDLGRNDIAFLLLSMRGASSHTARAPESQAGDVTAAAPPSAKRPARGAVVPAKSAPPVVTQQVQRSPQLFAHDGGAAIPSIGFLGFDPERGMP